MVYLSLLNVCGWLCFISPLPIFSPLQKGYCYENSNILIQNILSLNIPRPKEAHRSLTRISFTTYSITAVTIHETSEVCFCPVYSDLKDKLLHSLLISPIGQLVASEATDHLSSISSRNFQSMKEAEKRGWGWGR